MCPGVLYPRLVYMVRASKVSHIGKLGLFCVISPSVLKDNNFFGRGESMYTMLSRVS